VTVVELEVAADGGFEFAGTAMDATAQLFFGQRREPALDQIKPRGAGRREVQMETGMAQQPALDRWSFMGPVVVEDEVKVESAGHRGVNRLKELAELECPVAAMELADHRAGLDVECGGEQVGGAMPQVVVRTPLGLTGPQRQQWLTAVERLDLRFFIDAQDQLIRRGAGKAPRRRALSQ